MLDADPAAITKPGTVTIDADGLVIIAGFECDGATCRDVAALAMVWAIGKLQQELMLTLEAPGKGNSVID